MPHVKSEYVKGPFTETINKFGSNIDVDNSVETVWFQGGLYNYLTNAILLNVSSSSVNDDAAGSGALTVQIEGLDVNYDPQTEIITMDGRTIVNTTKRYIRVFSATVLTAGAGGTNAGTIFVYKSMETNGTPDDSTKIHTTIGIGKSKTLQALFTVPAEKKGTIDTIVLSSVTAAQSVTIELVARTFGSTVFPVEFSQVFIGRTETYTDLGLEFGPKTDIEIRATGAVNNNSVSASFVIDLIED